MGKINTIIKKLIRRNKTLVVILKNIMGVLYKTRNQ